MEEGKNEGSACREVSTPISTVVEASDRKESQTKEEKSRMRGPVESAD
jgi:hypothetical protein